MISSSFVLIICILVCLRFGSLLAFSISEETDLRSNLLENYTYTIRPEATVKVSLSFQAIAITSVDIKNQQFGISGWWLMTWSDTRLMWVPGSYGGIPILQFKNDQIWTPALVVDNSVNDLSSIHEDTIPLRVDASGKVTWNPPALLTVSCTMDITYFPFDTQTCALQVTSFGYTKQELSIFVYGSGVVLSYFSPDGEWRLLDNWTDRKIFTEDNYEYSKVYYYFSIKRRPLYYGLNYLLPVLITSLLTIFVFVLPAESGEKIGYCLTVLLGYMVILTLIAADLPTTAEYTSILELYIAVVLIMGGLSVILSIYVLELHHRPDDQPISNFTRRMTMFGMRLCCYEGCCVKKVSPTEYNSNNETKEKEAQQSADDKYLNGFADPLGSGTEKLESSGLTMRSPWVKQHSYMGLRPATPMSTPEEQSRGVEVTWQTVAYVLDGVLLRIYLLAVVVCSCVFLAILCTH
ncbi:neuronal acetylcholine receptor subunit alpha-6 [Biomphalaria pfeifferi]|uniref:Neuronal acetylcholine receptor subunit alpha-6 n=1 Tax=Biomphalaria pfeifferi TaxID=112525 RepID=A0AAD8EXZ5_BIOPF|nr:neuronal acetylcholine receptor subunit alpha-6 [Biomphalaria pfeifferi]